MSYKKKWITINKAKKDSYTYEELYTEYWPQIHMAFYKAINDYHMAEDLAQNVMARVYRYWHRIQWDKLEGALAVIVNNVRYDYLKANFDRPDKEFCEDYLEFDSHDEGISDPLRLLVTDRATEAVMEFTTVLRDKDREFFLDFYVRDINLDELCEKHEMNRPHVYVRLHRIRELLFDCFERYDLLPDGDWNRGIVST